MEKPEHSLGETPSEGMHVNAPRKQDVASTRDRKWHSHEQNVFYRDLIYKTIPNIQTKGSESVKNAAERIVDIIMIDKRGVFVKEAPTGGWIVMSRAEAVCKVQQAFRTYRIKVENGRWNKQRKKNNGSKKNPPTAAKKTILQAQAGTETSIHPYALLLISAVCNQQEPLDALHVLDNPMRQCFPDGEPPKERTMRLQLRQRYAGAISMGIAPITFSERLLELWGGSLTKMNYPDSLPSEPEKTAPETACIQNSSQSENVNDGPTDVEP